MADFDSDGDLDIWRRVNGPDNDVYLRNDNGSFSLQPAPYEYLSNQTTRAHVRDFDGDGHVDIIAQPNGQGTPILFLKNDGTGVFSTPAVNPFAGFNENVPPAFSIIVTSSSVADFDSDGDLDIWTRVSGSDNDVYLRNENGAFTVQPTPFEYTGSLPALVQLGDFNGDGHIDIIYQQSSANSPITYVQNNGSGGFSEQTHPFSDLNTSLPNNFTLSQLATEVADFDSDGDFDIWVRVNGSSNDVYLKGSGEAPVLTQSDPVNNADDFPLDQNITLTFDKNVVTGPGNIYIRLLADHSVIHAMPANGAAVSGSGSTTLTINPPADLIANTAYYITFDRNAITDEDDNLIFGYVDTDRKVRAPYTSDTFLRFSTINSLPVTLISFTVTENEGKALLEWQTTSEQNSASFFIQRSTDGRTWTNIGTIAAAGYSSTAINYSFVDNDMLQSRQYYRLLQVDTDAKQQLSKVLTLAGASTRLVIYPNPTTDEVLVRLPGTGRTTVRLYNMSGQEVYHTTTHQPTVRISLRALPASLYRVVLQQDGTVYSQSLLRI